MEIKETKPKINIKEIKNKTNLFGSIIKWFSKGDEDREAFWWDIFRRYEVTIGICVGAIIALIVSTIIYPIIGSDCIKALSKDSDIAKSGLVLSIVISGIIASLFLAWLMVILFYYLTKGETFSPHRRYDISPARMVFTNIFSVGGVIFIAYAIARLLYKSHYISSLQGVTIAIVLTILLIIVAINALSYCNWRFDWAIDNQDKIYDRYDQYRTSNVYFASERMQWKHLRWYKMMVATVLIADPSILGTSYVLTTQHSNKKNKTTKVENKVKAGALNDNKYNHNSNGKRNLIRYCINSKNYGYVNVREMPSTNSPVVKEIYDGESFYGNRLQDNPDWIEYIDENNNVIGYVKYDCVKKPGDKGYFYEDNESQKEQEEFKHEVQANADINSSHYHFSGYMTDDKGDHPIELDFDASNKGLTNIVYKNVTLGGKIHMKCTNFSGIYMAQDGFGDYSEYLDYSTIVGKDGPKDFIMSMTRVGNCPYEGTAAVGTKHLTVTLYLE